MPELTEDLIERVGKAVLDGEFPRTVLIKLGVPSATAGRWLARAGEEAQEAGDGPSDSLFVRLQRTVDVAESECEGHWLRCWKGAIADGRRLAPITGWKDLMAARFPDRWGSKYTSRQSAPVAPKSIEQMLASLQGGKPDA